VLSWNVIVYGAALSTVLGVVLALLAGRQRRPLVLATLAVGTFAGPVAWNVILRATHADQFFTDAPIPVFPISWQDTGSGVFTLAALTLLLGLGPLRTSPAHRVITLAVLGALAALLVDIYLY
jgi:hypothetical protein